MSATLIEQLISGTYECFCLERIQKHQPIWTCSSMGGCANFFHYSCIEKWYKSQNKSEWSCPKCRTSMNKPPVASCFCGKSHGNFSDRFTIPHSCGEECSKKRSVDCPHVCTLACHPGPCPPCSAMALPKSCYCGKTSYVKPCGQSSKEGMSCVNTCDKPLTCGRHQCTLTCHDGPCPGCPESIMRKCYCGKKAEERPCGSEQSFDLSNGFKDIRTFSCEEVCERTLACTHHKCEKKCHPSLDKHSPACEPCQLTADIILTCPCGKNPISHWPARVSCEDPIPTCDSICGKYLSCKKHKCQQKCHLGDCGKCEEPVILPCACGTKPPPKQTFYCSDVYPNNYQQIVSENLCNRGCSAPLSCGRHTCKKKCCPSRHNKEDPEGYHICRNKCAKTLNCGKHTCNEICHQGKCHDCYADTGVVYRTCPCGKTTQFPPINCGSSPPVCPFDCPKATSCGHTANRHPCHWEGECPPCIVLVKKSCSGDHMIMNAVPCYKPNVECGRKCNKNMSCMIHNCSRLCHPGPCEIPLPKEEQLIEDEKKTQEDYRPSCGQKCELPLVTCSHKCQFKCHPRTACPEVKCNMKSKIWCECGRISMEVACIGIANTTLSCDELCLKELRQKKLADAFGVLPTDKPTSYSESLINLAKAIPLFVKNIETELTAFFRPGNVKTQLKLPSAGTMDKIQAMVVGQLAKYYFLTVETVGSDSNHKQVVLTKKMGSRCPTVLLSQVIQINNTTILQSTERNGQQVFQSTNYSPTTESCTLHLYDISKQVRNSHIDTYLKDFEGSYVIQWIDEDNALCIFKHHSSFQKALLELKDYNDETTGLPLFKTKIYHDYDVNSTSSFGNTNNNNNSSTISTNNSSSNVWLRDTEKKVETDPTKYVVPTLRPGYVAPQDKPKNSEVSDPSQFKQATKYSKEKPEAEQPVYATTNYFSVLSNDNKKEKNLKVNDNWEEDFVETSEEIQKEANQKEEDKEPAEKVD